MVPRVDSQLRLIVGRGGMPWDAVIDSSAFVQMDSDSIWTWSAPVDQNIADRVVARGGGAYLGGVRPLQTAPRRVYGHVYHPQLGCGSGAD